MSDDDAWIEEYRELLPERVPERRQELILRVKREHNLSDEQVAEKLTEAGIPLSRQRVWQIVNGTR